jgi:predicted phosphoadenosine phosphosulfate sulfurtransferase
MLYVTLEVARELGKTPLEVVYIDHEIEGVGTYELLNEVRAMKDVNLKWYSLPYELRNAASIYAPMWYPYHPQEKELWVNQIPDHAITEMEGFYFEYDEDYQHPDGSPFKALGVKRAMTFQEIADLHALNYIKKGINTINLVGLRAEESLARFTVMARKTSECYISSNQPTAYPIYDWNATDVWKYIRDSGLPYNKEYDLMNKTEHFNKLNKQRVGSVFAEESLRTLHQWREFYGDYWHKILDRAEGIKTAWRYCNSDLYSGSRIQKEDNVTFEEYAKKLIEKMSPETKKLTKKAIHKIVVWHSNQTAYPIADKDKDACPMTGISWEFLAKIVIKGDTKARQLQKVPSLAKRARARAGLTRDEAVNKYGRPEYKKQYYENKKRN